MPIYEAEILVTKKIYYENSRWIVNLPTQKGKQKKKKKAEQETTNKYIWEVK